MVELRSPSGATLDAQEESLGAGSDGPGSWSVGRWLVQRSFVRVGSAPPGDYDVAVAVYDSRARRVVPIDGQPGSRDVVVGRLTVR